MVDIKKLNLEAGDIVVAEFPRDTSVRDVNRLREVLHAVLARAGHSGVEAILLPKGFSVATVKEKDLKDIYQRLDDLERKYDTPQPPSS